MGNWLLRLHAWYYRLTGVYTKYAERKEKEYIASVTNDNTSEVERSILTSSWHVKYGFYMSSEQMKKHIKKRLKKLKNLRRRK